MYYERNHHVFMAEADDGGSGASGGSGTAGTAIAPGAGATGAAGIDPAATSGGAGTGSALAAGAAAAGGAVGTAQPVAAVVPPAGPNDWLPEKYRVVGEDGKTLNLEASARKVAEAHGHLERRLGSGDAPPSTAEGYKVNVPAALADKINAEDLTKTDDFKGFLGKLHAAGASQKVVDTAVAEMLERGVKMQSAMPILAQAEAEAAMRQVDGWKTEADYGKQIGLAFRAASGFGDKCGVSMQEIESAGLANNPVFLRIMAAVGPEMGEDRQASSEAMAQISETIESLMSSKAYLSDNDPQHTSVLAKVTALQEKRVGNRAAASGRTMSFTSG